MWVGSELNALCREWGVWLFGQRPSHMVVPKFSGVEKGGGDSRSQGAQDENIQGRGHTKGSNKLKIVNYLWARERAAAKNRRLVL